MCIVKEWVMAKEKVEAISALFGSLNDSKLSRRTVLKRGALAAVSVPMISSLLAACEGPDDVDDEGVDAAELEDDESVEDPEADVDDDEVEDDDEADVEGIPDVDPEDVDIGAHLIGELEGPEVVDEMPDSFAEAPMLAEMVDAGELPPVEERIGSQPMVIRPVHEIGQYGGTLRRAKLGPGDTPQGNRLIFSSSRVLFWDYTATEITPCLAHDWEMSDDGREFTFHLREGMHWSDGEPFTSADFLWWFEHIYGNEEYTPVKNPATAINGQQGTMEVDGDYTVRWTFPEPYPMFDSMLASSSPIGGPPGLGGIFGPGHYLQQFHPEFIGDDEAHQMAEDAGYDNWVTYFEFLNNWALNPDLPVISAWKTTSPMNEPNWILERNPYFWAVDTEGNQLPYIDTVIQRNAEDLEVITLRALAGEIDFMGRHIDLGALPVLLENQEEANYTIHLDPALWGADAMIMCNQSWRGEDDGDDEIVELINEPDFRRALSLGIDRDQLNEALWLGLGTPGSCIPGPDSPQNPGEEEWRSKWHVLDPDQANELLDGLGLTERDAEGYRLRRDNGERLRIRLSASGARLNWPAVCEMVVFQLSENIGIQIDFQELEDSLWWERNQANELQLSMWFNDGSENMDISPNMMLPVAHVWSGVGPQHATWAMTDGESGIEPSEEMKRAQEIWFSAAGMELEERNEAMQEIWRIITDDVWAIGTVGLSPIAIGVRVVNNNVGNSPSRHINGKQVETPSVSHPPTLFFRS
jgi:peptide/nickel transport system substrate-binding protein